MAGNEGFLHWQANARGVDLNHNYSVGFDEYKKIESEKEIIAGPTLYSGEYPESEPESHSLANLARTVNFALSVSLHSQGEEIYYFPKEKKSKNTARGKVKTANEKFKTEKDKETKTDRAASLAARCARRLSHELGYKLSEPEGTACYGGFSDYTAGALGIPSLTVEVGRGKNPLPEGEYFRIKERFSGALFSLALESF